MGLYFDEVNSWLKFLEYEVWFDVCDKKGVMFYIFVYEVGNDDIVVMLIICMMN